MKKISKILLVLLMLMAASFTAMACNTKTVDSISVKSDDMPVKTVYIIGSDTEFSPFGGTLTVHYSDGSEETVSLENEKVSFSGFDPDKAGSQKITVKYEDKTCEITIRVIKRFTIVGVETNYFIGEELNRSGKLVLTKDDGTNQEILFNDPTVSISGAENFSASEGEKTLTVSYGGYTDKIQLKVHNVAKATPAFGNTIYMSHQNQLDLSSAKLTLQNQASVDNKVEGAVKKDIYLTRELLNSCGVDDQQIFNDARQELLSKIDGEMQGGDYSSEKFVTRDIDFTYAGKQLSFSISVYLSRQSYIMYYADKYAGINYQGEVQKDAEGNVMLDENGNEIREIEFTADQENVEKVTYVTKMYFDLSDEDKAAVEPEERNALVKLAGYHWYHKWLNVISTGELAKTFNLNYSPYTGASLTLNVSQTYEESVETRDFLKEENTLKELNAINNDLWQILGNEELGNLVVYTMPGEGEDAKDINITLKTFLQLAVPQDQVELLVAQLDNAIALYDSLDGVKLSDVENYATITDGVKAKVIATYNAIVDESNQFRGNRPHFALIKLWNNQYFDILYQYYWNITRQDPKVIGMDAWTNGWNALVKLAADAILPCEELENFYSTAVQLLDIMNLLNNNYSYDATELYYYYSLLNEYAEKLDNIDNNLYKGLYEEIGYSFPIISEEANNYVTIGYAMNRIEKLMTTFLGISQDIPEIKKYFDFYIDMYEKAEKSVENKYVEFDESGESKFTQEYIDDVEKLINDFFALSPTNQFIFLNTISVYDIRLLNIKSYTSTEGVPTSFTGFIASYYNNINLSDKALDVCDDLFFAYECYLRRMTGSKVTNFDSFFEYYVRYGKPEYENLVADEKKQLEAIFNKTTAIYEMYDADQNFIPVEINSIGNEAWEARFTELQKAVEDFYLSYVVVANGIETNLPFICSYLKVEEIYNKFVKALESETDEALKAKVLELLQYGEFEIVSLTLNGQNINADGNIEYYLMTTWNSFLNYSINAPIDISGNSITINDLFNEELNPGFKQMFIDMADFIIQAQYYLFDDNTVIDFSNIENAGETFRKFFAAPDDGYSLDQKNVINYLDSMRGLVSDKTLPFTRSAIAYYAEQINKLDNLTAEQIGKLSSAVVNYIAVVEGYMEYYSLLIYNEDTLSQFDPESLLNFNNAVTDMEKGYDESISKFRDMYQAMSDAERAEFDKFFNESSRSFFMEKPVKPAEK